MTRWTEVPLHDICRPTQWPTIQQTELTETGYPVYGANGKIGFYSEYNHEEPTILITCRGATCGTINVCEPKSYVTGNAMSLDDLDERADLGFVVQALRFRGVAKAITGTAQPQITRQSLTAVTLPLPPLPEQRRIAAILDKADELRAKRRAALEKLNTLTQATFAEMFGMPRDNPKGWNLVTLADICSPKQWPTIRVSELVDSGFPVFGANGFIGRYGEYNHDEPTVVVTCRGATCGTVNVTPPKCYVTGNAMALDDPDTSRVTLEYLEVVLRLRGLDDAISGTAQPQITRQSLAPTRIPLPPVELQKTFSSMIVKIKSFKSEQESSLQSIGSLFQSLQYQAFTGAL